MARAGWLALGTAALVAGCSVPLPRPDTTPDVPITTPTPRPDLRDLPPEPLAATPRGGGIRHPPARRQRRRPRRRHAAAGRAAP